MNEAPLLRVDKLEVVYHRTITAVQGVSQARRALEQLGANLLVVPMAGTTFFEFKALLSLAGVQTACPPALASTLSELDGHAHR